MPERYTAHFNGPLTAITPEPAGPWPRWEMARAVAVEHLEGLVAACERTLQVLRAGSFFEYEVLVGELESRQEAEDELAQVVEGGTLT